ncbi:MAG: DNA-directed RNA polymerase subunit RpoH/Rpb5 C-terminal domain-containing protein [Candidatus Korarchaeota archaeon]|nr:DNA-directed RNA polymerase subunit RpoH/Rpb5 C-terminal domain-containing protein [Candidatus Korarchaeota archaeon]
MVESEDVPVDIDLDKGSDSLNPSKETKSSGKKSSGKSSSKAKKTAKVKKEKKAQKKTKTARTKRVKKAIKYDPTENFMVPKHEIVSEDEKRELERMYGSLDMFPKILVTDPIVMKLGAKEGDLIRIHREEGFYYRYVVSRS